MFNMFSIIALLVVKQFTNKPWNIYNRNFSQKYLQTIYTIGVNL